MAFQLVDDLLDYTAREDVLGKPMLGDLAEGKVTLPFLRFTEDGNPRLRQILRESLGDAEAVARHRDDILRMASESSGVDHVQAHAQAFAREAKNALEPFPGNRARRDLEALTEFVLSRKK
jgi:octaprenyl-diphosphate synthase